MNEVYQWLIDNKDQLMFKFIYKMIPNKDDAEDFYQDLFLIISDKDPVKMKRIYDNDEMSQYVYVIIKNNLKSRNSRYYYKYRKPIGEELDDFMVPVDTTLSQYKKDLLEEIEMDYNNLLKKIEKHFNIEIKKNPRMFYDKTIFKMYYDDDNDRTFRSLSDELGIPTTSIYNTVKRNKDRIEWVFRKEIKAIQQKIYIYYDDDIN